MDPDREVEPGPAQRFVEMITGPPPGLQLDAACALLAASFTGVDRSAEVQQRLDELAALCAEASLQAVMEVMRSRVRGNVEDYYDPRNSYVDQVLERGVGLPITVSVIAIEIGRRLGIPIAGVGLPAHFMVRDERVDLFADPFGGGTLYDRTGVIAAWERLVGPGAAFDDVHLLPASERSILIRMLNNLRALFLQRGDARGLHTLVLLRGAFAELAHEEDQHARWMRHWN